MEKSNVINSEAMYDKIRDLYKKIDHNKAKCEAQRDQIDQIAAFLTEARQNNQINANLAIVENQFEIAQSLLHQTETELSEYMRFLKMVLREMKQTSIEYDDLEIKYGDKIVDLLSVIDS